MRHQKPRITPGLLRVRILSEEHVTKVLGGAAYPALKGGGEAGGIFVTYSACNLCNGEIGSLQ